MKTLFCLTAAAALLPLSAFACEEHAAQKTGAARLIPAAMTTAAPAQSALPAQTATGQATAGPLAITGGYMRSANPRSAAAFMSIANTGDAACTLKGVSSDVADRVELHSNKDEGGVMKMVPLASVEIPPKGGHDLARGGDHVMFLGLHNPLKEGDAVALTLDFGDCGSVPLTVAVDNKAGMEAAAPMDHAPMDHGRMDHGQPPADPPKGN